jgi:predicted RNA-binding protein YlqC (UPF0109 family)
MTESNNIEELVKQVVLSLVDDAESVKIEVVDKGNALTLNVQVHPDDVGKIIGRQGRVIKSLRTLARAASTYSGGKHVEVEVLD